MMTLSSAVTEDADLVNDESGTETFAEIPGVHGYEVSDSGCVRHVETGRHRKLLVRQDGYTSVTIRRHPYLVHHLVMRAHIGLTPPGHNIDHIDRNRSNNTLGNLRFATPSTQNQNRGVVTRKVDHSVVRIDEQGAETLYNCIAVAAEALQSTRKMPTVITRIYAAVRTGCLYQGFLWKKRKQNDCQWTPIPSSVIYGHQGYFASPDGQIKMLDGRGTLGSNHSSGYRFVNIMGKKTRVHILIAGTFLEPLEGRSLVNHKNGDKTDNRVSNLEYVNHRENTTHAHTTGLIAQAPGRVVEACNNEGHVLASYDSLHAAGRAVSGFCSNIVACCQGRQKSAYGFTWRYRED